MRASRKVAAFALVALFVAVALPAPATANPLIPYCPASIPGGSSATNDQYLVEACMTMTGRVFPEAHAHEDYIQGPNGFTGVAPYVPASDYVGYFEFQQALEYLSVNYPDWIEVHEVALSSGNNNLAGGPDRLPVYMLEISNEQSPMPRDEKMNLLFMLSIHGNEKGGREGGFRVLEDLLRNIGFATETVQNGAGLAEPITTPTGKQVTTYHDMLDFMNIFLLFPNSDGWVCDELEYGAGDPLGISTAFGADGCAGNFRRTNADGSDLNRQTPTIGWQNPGRNVMGEPESGGPNDPDYPGFANWLVEQRENSDGEFQWDYAIDIHGMLNHKNFGAIMLPAGSFTPQEMHRSLRLADTLKDRWNEDSHFSAWRTAFQTAETGWAVSDPARQAFEDLCGQFTCPLAGSGLSSESSPSEAAGSSQFAEYYTVIDAIGYTDSGFNGDFFAQTTGLNAPGYDIELAYNHITTGAQYEGAGAFFNDYHVWMVRHIVKSFMDAAAQDVRISYETDGVKTAYIPSQFVATNLDDVDADGNPALTPGGWADENPGDDKWDYGAEDPFFARPAKYWEDIKPFVCQDCGTDNALPGVFEARTLADLDASALDNFDTLVISGSAINQFYATGEVFENTLPRVPNPAYDEDDTSADAEPQFLPGQVDQAKVDLVLDWVANGGKLVLTDAALKFFDLAGITTDAVDRTTGYMGGIRMDLSHPMLNKINGGVKQTYEPTPLGFGTSGASPNWAIDAQAYSDIGGSVAGLRCAGNQLSQNCAGNDVSLGLFEHGEGEIQFMGAVLPDPTEEFYHPYGLDNYATTYSANQIVRNMLGWDEVFANPPITFDANGKIVQADNEPTEPLVAGEEPAAAGKDSPGFGLLALLAAVAAALVVRRK